MIIIYSFPHPGEGKQNIKGGKEEEEIKNRNKKEKEKRKKVGNELANYKNSR
jgi:hypothetical protein